MKINNIFFYYFIIIININNLNYIKVMEQIHKEEKEYTIKNDSSNKNYKVKLIKGQNSIIFNAKEIGDIKDILYKIEVAFNKFEKMDKYFRQFDNIDELYLDVSRRQSNEIKVEEIEENIKLTLIYEIRSEKKDLPFILIKGNADINKIVMNLCEKSKEIDDLKQENLLLKYQISELQFYVSWIFNYFDNKNGESKHYMPKVKNEWILDSQNKDWKSLDISSQRYHPNGNCNIY